MPASTAFRSSLLVAFSTFVDRCGLNHTEKHLATEFTQAFLQWKTDLGPDKSGLDHWSMAEIDRFAATQVTPSHIVQVLKQFIHRFPPSQIGVFLHEYLLALNDDGCSNSTIRNYRSDINQFASFAGVSTLNDLIAKPVLAKFVRYEEEKGLQASSVRRKLASIAQFGLWAQRQGILSGVEWLDNSRLLEEINQKAAKTAATPILVPIIETPPPAQPRVKAENRIAVAHRVQEQRARLQAQLDKVAKNIRQQSQAWLLPYLTLTVLVIAFLGLGVFGYQQFINNVPSPLAYPSSPTRPNRVLSFQGRLSDTAQNPITVATDMQFELFDDETVGSSLWDSGTCSITPDQDGIFASGLGDDCGTEISSDVFTENANVWLEVTVEGETLTPRQPIRTVAYALNAETLQGYPISATGAATVNTIVFMDGSGDLVLGEISPGIRALSGQFIIEGESIQIQTKSGSNGNIILDADGIGGTITRDYFSAPGATLSATYAGGTPLTLKGGPSGTANILSVQDSSSNVLSVFDEAGWLGILNSNPSSPLSVGSSSQFQVNSSGAIAAATGITSSGTITFSGFSANGGLLYTNGSGVLAQTAVGGASECLLSAGGGSPTWGSCSAAVGSSIIWQQVLGTAQLKNSTLDLLVGGTSTTSAKFAFINVNSGTPTASIAGSVAGYGVSLTGDGTLATTLNRSLILNPNGGNVGIGTTNPLYGLAIGSEAVGLNARLFATHGSDVAPTFDPANWTATNGWSADGAGTQLTKISNASVGTITPSGVGATPVVGTAYKVVITASATSGAITYTFGGVTGSTIVGGTTITDYITAQTTGKLIISGAISSTATITAVTIQPLTNNTGDLTVDGDLRLAGRLVNPSGTLGLEIQPNGSARFGGSITGASSLAIAGAISGATTIAHSGAITGTVPTLYVSTDALVMTAAAPTGVTAALVPLDLSPRFRQIGQAWDIDGAANVLNNFWSEVIPYPGNTVNAKLSWYFSQGAMATSAEYQAPEIMNYYNNSLNVLGSTYGTENFTNGSLTSGTSWSASNGFSLTANTAVYVHSASGGTLTQTSGNFAVPVKPNRWYRFTWTSSALNTTARAYIDPTGISQEKVYLRGTVVSAGTYTTTFKTNSNPGNFILTADSNAASDGFTLDDLSLVEVTSGDVVANGLFTGGGTTGMKIDQDGKVGIGTTSPTAVLQVNGGYGTNDAFTVNQLNSGNILTASASGVTRLTLENDGDLNIGGDLAITGGNITTAVTADSTLTVTGTLTANGTLDGNGIFTLGDNGDTGAIDTSSWDISSGGAASGFTGISSSGTITFSAFTANGGLLYTNGSGTLAQTAVGNSGECLISAGGGSPTWSSCSLAAANNFWRVSSGAISPYNDTLDLLIGANSTASAKFAFLNVNSGTPTASISANSGNIATYIKGDGTLATTNRQTLTIGNSSTYDTTGNVLINPNGTGRVGIGTTAPGMLFDVASAGTGNIARFKGASGTGGSFTIAGTSTPGSSSINLISDDLNSSGFSFSTRNAAGTGIRMVLDKDGNTGIGTTSPLATLDVRGTSGTTPVASISGQTSFAAMVVDNKGVGDIFTASSSGLNRFVITQNGNVGIGTTLPGQPLTVKGTNGSSTIGVLNTSNALVAYLYPNGNGAGNVSLTNSSAVETIRLSGDATAGVHSYFNAGNLGIGTTAPTAKLDVVGTASVSSTLSMGGAIQPSTGNLTLNYKSGANAWTAAQTIDTVGNIGIGTTAPASRLDVLSSSTSLAAATFRGGSTINAHASSGGINIGAVAASMGVVQYSFGAGDLYIDNTWAAAGGDIHFRTQTAGTPVNAMTITGAGNVGIGSTSPATTLDVVGTASVSSTLTMGGAIQPSTGNLTLNYKSGANAWTAAQTIDTVGNVGIGTTTPTARLDVQRTADITGTSINVAQITGNLSATSTISNNTNALNVSLPVTLTGDPGSRTITGITSLPYMTNSSTVNPASLTLRGIYAAAANDDAGQTLGNAIGLTASAGQSRAGGTTTNAKAIYTFLQNTDAITDGYNVYIDNANSSGTITNQYGLYIADMTDGTADYALVTNAGNVVFNEGGDSATDLRVEGDTLANLLFVDASADSVGIGDSTPDAMFTVGTTSQFQVNSSGAVAAATGLTSSGTITFSGLTTNGGVLYTNGTGGLVAQTATGTAGECLTSAGGGSPVWASCSGSVSNYWRIANGAISPYNDTLDLLIGSNATTSAKFAVLNVNSGTPTASIAGSVAGNALSLTGDGTIATSNNRSLLLNPSGGNVGVGTSAPTAAFNVGVNGGSVAIGDGSNTSAHININATRTMVGYDGSFATFQGGVSKGIKFNVNSSSFGAGTVVTIDTSGNMGIGTTTPTAPLFVRGSYGSNDALTVDQRNSGNIFTASASGATKFTLENDGDIVSVGDLAINGDDITTDGTLTLTPTSTLTLNSTGDMTLDSSTDIILDADGADIFFKDAGTTIATFTNSTTDLTLDIAGGNLLLANNDVLNVGGAAATAYNFFAGATTNNSIADGDNDLYIEDELEVDGVTQLDGTLTGNGQFTLGDNGDTGVINTSDWDINATGDLAGIGTIASDGDWTMTQADPTISLVDSGGDDYTVNVDANVFTIINSTDSRTELSFAGDGGIDFGDNTATKTIDIGGVTSSAIDTINIATNGTAADVISIGNSNASTTLALTGGDDWSITAAGALDINGQFDLGDGGDTGSVNTSSWDISTGGAASGFTGIVSSGTITFSGLNTAGGVIYAQSGGTLAVSAAGNSGECLLSAGAGTPTWGSCSVAAANNFWRVASGAISPYNDTLDLLIGSNATVSAKFAVLNVNSGTPTASISANSGNIATYIKGDGTIATTNRQTLTIGNSSTYDTTGNVLINSNGTGNVGIGTTTVNAKLDVSGTASVSSTLSMGGAIQPATGNLTFNYKSGANAWTAAQTIDTVGNVGIGDTTPLSLFTVGSGDLFRINSSGEIAAIDGVAHTVTDSSGDLSINSNGGSLLLADTDTIVVGGLAGAAYNAFSDSGTAGSAASDDDLYVEDILEVDGTLVADGTLDGNGVFTLGDNGDTGAIDTSSWDISSGGAASGFTGISSSGTITFSGLNTAGGVIYAQSGGTLAVSAAGNSGECFLSAGAGTPTWGSCATAVASSILWQSSLGTAQLKNTTLDLLVGGVSSASAKFAVLNVNNGTPTASVSAGTAGAAYLNATGSLGTTAQQSLTLGGATTGDVLIQPNSDTGDYFRFSSDGTNLTLNTTDGSNLTVTPAGLLNLNSTGDMTLDSSTDINLDADGADILFKDAGTTFVTFTNSTTDLTLDIAGGNLLLANNDVLNAGGAAATAYNFFAGSTSSNGTADGDNDLYIEDELEVDGLFTSQAITAGGLITANAGLTVASGQSTTLTGFNNCTGLTSNGSGVLACNLNANANINYWQSNAGLLSPYISSYSIALGGTATSSANIHLDATTGYINAQRFEDKANSGFYLDPAASTTSLIVAGALNAGGATVQNYNFLAASTAGNATADNSSDLYIQDELEVDGAFTLGDAGDLGAISTSDWAISTTGSLTGISGIANDGAYTQSGTSANTFTGATAFTANSATALTVTDGSQTYLTFDTTTDAADTLFNLTGGSSSTISTGNIFALTGDTITTGKVLNISADALTSGNGILVDSTSTSLTGAVASFTFNGVGTVTGDLLSLDLGATSNVGKIFNVKDNGSTVFSVGESTITSALPHEFTAAGDLSVAYDIQFTNQTASFLKSYGPLTIESGESFESLNLTFKTYNSGGFAFNNETNGNLAFLTGTGLLGVGTTSPTAPVHIRGAYGSNAALIIDQRNGGNILAASGSGTTRLVLTAAGSLGIGSTSPQTTLDVTGTASISGILTSGGGIKPSTGDLTLFYKSAADGWTNGISLTSTGRVGILDPSPTTTLGVTGTASISSTLTVGGVIRPDTGVLQFNYKNGANTWADALVISNLGYIGLNTTNPSNARLQINMTSSDDLPGWYIDSAESATTTVDAWAVESSTTNNSQSANTVKAHMDVDGSLFVSFTGTQTTNGVCHAGAGLNNNNEVVDCSGTPGDYAEWYPVENNTQAGDIVAITPQVFEYDAEGADASTGQVYQLGKQNISVLGKAQNTSKFIGVISTAPHSVIGEDIKKTIEEDGITSFKPEPIALAGRVPVKMSSDSPSVQAGDLITVSTTQSGKGTKASGTGMAIGKALEAWSPASGKPTVLVFINYTWYDTDLDLTASGDLNIDYDTNTQTATLVDENGDLVEKLGAFSEATIANLEAGVINARKLIVDTFQVTGTLIANRLNANQVSTDLLTPVSTDDLTIKLESSDVDGTAGELKIVNEDDQAVASIDGDGNATFSGTATISEADITSARIQTLESRLAEVEQIKAQTADIVTATVSGTLYADNIYQFQDKVAAALQEPSLLSQLMGNVPEASSSASLASVYQIVVDQLPLESTGSGSLNKSLADLNLDEGDVSLGASALFINNYFELNGSGYVSESLGIGQNLLIGNGTQISDGIFNYVNPVDPSATLLSIQPSGKGTLSLMAGLMTLSEDGNVKITGNLEVTGDLKVKNTLLTNLLKSDDLTKALQVQVAGVSTESGEVVNSRFEITNELNTPVATISAQGKATFADGISVGSDDLSASTSATVTTNKTSGKATIKQLTTELTIKSTALTPNSLIYVTPLGSTGNKVLYVKAQTADDPLTLANEASFVVGFDSMTITDVSFNWWIVN